MNKPTADQFTRESYEINTYYLDELPTNTNKMEDQDFANLCESMKAFGFLQPILVVPIEDTDRYTVVDGAHRVKAAKAVGLTMVKAINVEGLSPAHIRALQMSMNRLRGEPNLAEVARQMAAIQEEVDLSLTGYSTREIERLLNATNRSLEEEDRAMEEAALTVQEEEKEAKVLAGVVLEVDLPDVKAMRDIKKAAKKLGGGDVGTGIMRALGILDTES